MKKHDNIIPITEAREELPELVDKAKRLHNRYYITKRGEAQAVIMSAEEFESWGETLDVLSSKSEMKAIKKSLSDIKNNKVKSFKKVFGEEL